MTAKTFLYFICSNEYVYDNFSYEECYGTRNVSSCIMYVDQNQNEYHRLGANLLMRKLLIFYITVTIGGRPCGLGTELLFFIVPLERCAPGP